MKITTIFMCIILICSLLLCSCSSFYYEHIDPILFPEEQYYKGANWNCELDVFTSTYLELYTKKIEELKEKYDLSFAVKCEIEDNLELKSNQISFLLYTEEYTFRFVMNNGIELGSLDTYLYYYGYYANPDVYPEYSTFEHLFAFINDFTNYVGYDTKTDKNYFDTLYFEAVDNKDEFASYHYHYDSTIGNVGYLADLDSEEGYYYIGAYDTTVKKACSRFWFEGILKPLI